MSENKFGDMEIIAYLCCGKGSEYAIFSLRYIFVYKGKINLVNQDFILTFAKQTNNIHIYENDFLR